MALEINPRKASEKKKLARIIMQGPAGSGKTYTGIGLANAIAMKIGKPILVLDTQGVQADMYASEYEFDVQELNPDDHNPRNFVKVIEYAEENDYGVIVLDSITHAWEWTLKFVGDLQSVQRNQWTAWGEGGEPWSELINKILFSRIHIVACSRSKVHYEQQTANNGKKQIVKMGMQPIIRSGTDFEFDMICEMTAPDNVLVVTKGRAKGLNGEIAKKPGDQFFAKVTNWLFTGEEAEPRKAPAAAVSVDVIAIKEKVLELKSFSENAEAVAKNLAEEYGFKEKWSNLKNLGPVKSKELNDKLDSAIELHGGSANS